MNSRFNNPTKILSIVGDRVSFQKPFSNDVDLERFRTRKQQMKKKLRDERVVLLRDWKLAQMNSRFDSLAKAFRNVNDDKNFQNLCAKM